MSNKRTHPADTGSQQPVQQRQKIMETSTVSNNKEEDNTTDNLNICKVKMRYVTIQCHCIYSLFVHVYVCHMM